MRVTSAGLLPIAASPATIRRDARDSPQSTTVTPPSGSTNANELIKDRPTVGMRHTFGASCIAGEPAMALSVAHVRIPTIME
jgi:hypothetical protein